MFWALILPGAEKPCGVLLRLSSRPSSFRGTFGATSSSGICFCRRRFLLHSSWQSCQSGRLQRRRKLICKESDSHVYTLYTQHTGELQTTHTLVEAFYLDPHPWEIRCSELVQQCSVCWGPSWACGQRDPGLRVGCWMKKRIRTNANERTEGNFSESKVHLMNSQSKLLS